MNLFDIEFRRTRPFLTGLMVACILCMAFAGLMLVTLPETMDMDGFYHFLATVFLLPAVFALGLFISYPYFKIRSTLYRAQRDDLPYSKTRIILIVNLLVLMAAFACISFVGYLLLNSSSISYNDYTTQKEALN